MKTIILCCVLLIPLSAACKAETRSAAPAAATQTATAPAERQLAVLEPAGLATVPADSRHVAAAPPLAPPATGQPGWREQLALLGAALLALLFILRRQLAHRLGDRSAQAAPDDLRWEEPADKTSIPTANTGFMLSHFDNLPAEAVAVAVTAEAHTVKPLHRKARPATRKAARPKARWPARNRPPEA